ncbi:MAG: ABC transporter ATP-binding protein [Candidatus Thorarchaeota archaeon]
MIVCKDLIKIYSDDESNIKSPALRGCELTIEKGEIFTIVGPSGSGKTTLINVLAGLEKISSGQVHVADKYFLELMNEKELNKYRLEMVGIVDQYPERTLFLDGTILDNINFVLNINKKINNFDHERIDFILEKLGIKHLKKRIVRELSGGEMIRAAIACALAKEVPILLCDEPTGQLDSVNTNNVKDLLKQVSREFSTAILVVTHDPRFQQGVDKTCEIHDGRVSSIISMTEQEIYGKRRTFPLKFKRQLDSTNSFRLPDLVVDTMQLNDSVELQLNANSEVKLKHPQGIKPKKVVLTEIKQLRKTLDIEPLPDGFFDNLEPIIEMDNVSKIYGNKDNEIHALSNLSLKIKRGDLVFIVGPSGSGKSTLIKLLTGLEKSSNGSIRILNTTFNELEDSAKADFRRKNMGVVSQQGNLHPFLTIAENFYLKDIFSGKIIKEISSATIEEYLLKFKIEHRINSYPLEISGGELQRATLAIANKEYPPIIVLDEPTANLDSVLADKAMEEIYSLHQSTDISFIIATHDISLIKDGIRTIELEDGKIKRDGFAYSKE